MPALVDQETVHRFSGAGMMRGLAMDFHRARSGCAGTGLLVFPATLWLVRKGLRWTSGELGR